MIVVAGEALVDLVPGQDDALRAHPGGGPFNTARTIGRLGRPVAFLGRLSIGPLRTHAGGDAREPTASASAPSSTPTSRRRWRSPRSTPPAPPAYRFYERGTSAPGLQPAAALAALPAGVAVLHVGTLGIHLEPIATAIEALVERVAGTALVVVDPNVRAGVLADPAAFRARLDRLLERADLLKLSEDDLAWLTPGMPPDEGVRSLLGGARAGVVTLGGEGALVVGPTGAMRVAAPAVDVVDTIGAGDAFGGGLVAWWHMHDLGRDELGDLDALVEATAFACRVGGADVREGRGDAADARRGPGRLGREQAVPAVGGERRLADRRPARLARGRPRAREPHLVRAVAVVSSETVASANASASLGGDDEPGAVGHQPRQLARPRRDDRAAVGLRLRPDAALARLHVGQRHDARTAEQTRDVGLGDVVVADLHARVAQHRPRRAAGRLRRRRGARLGDAAPDPRHRMQEHVEALVARHAPEEQQRRAVRRRRERAARRCRAR